MTGLNINIPSDSKMLDTTKSITINGINNINPIWNAVFSSEIMNAGMRT